MDNKQKYSKINKEYITQRVQVIKNRCSSMGAWATHYQGRGIKCRFSSDEL